MQTAEQITPTLTDKQALDNFISRDQLRAINYALRGEEWRLFKDKMREHVALVQSMPKTYEQDGKGEQATAYLHYFTGACDWYITERDMEPEQLQAFGLADLGYGPELGYISIAELIGAGAELDLYFEPKTLAEITK